MDEFRQVDQRSLPGAHELQKFPLFRRGQGNAVFEVQCFAMDPVEFVQHLQHVFLVKARHLPAFVHEFPNAFLGEKAQKRLGVGKAPRRPDQFDVASPESGVELDAQAHRDSHDFRGLLEFLCGPGFDIVVVDDPQTADSLDPGVHNQMGGGFAPLGVEVVHVVVEGDLIPVLGHFQKMVFTKLLAHDPGLSGRSQAERVGQFQLPGVIPVRPDHLLHDLKQHSGRVDGHGTGGGVQHFVLEAAKCAQTVVDPAHFQGLENVDHRMGDANAPRFRHLLDPARMEVPEKTALPAVHGRLTA